VIKDKHKHKHTNGAFVSDEAREIGISSIVKII